MNIPIVNKEGKEVGTKVALTAWEHRPVQAELLHQAAVTIAANARIPWAHTKTRGEVRGGGRKPWKQKGTGRARAGSIRSPIWKGGGTTFGPRADRTYGKRFPANMRRVALAQALVAKVSAGELVLVQELPGAGKTGELAAFLKRMNRPGSTLFAVPKEMPAAFHRAVRNLPHAHVVAVTDLNVADVLSVKNVLCTPSSWETLEARLVKE